MLQQSPAVKKATIAQTAGQLTVSFDGAGCVQSHQFIQLLAQWQTALTWQEVVANKDAEEHKIVYDAFNFHRERCLDFTKLQLQVLS